MPRDLPVGNGSLLLAFDGNYCICDVYYPHVGHENHTAGHGFRFGVWVEGMFEWVGKHWDLSMLYKEDSLLTDVTARSQTLGVELKCNDCIDHIENIYIKQISLRNLSDSDREFRVFLHHDFHILESPTGDTAYYDPDERAVIHFKGSRYFLISGLRDGRQGIDQFSTGVKEFRGLEGTWRDAEDGVLGGNAIAQGSVDSVVSFTVEVPAGGAKTIHYWICAGRDFAEVSRLNRMVAGHGLEYFLRRTDNYWRAWVNKEALGVEGLPENIVKLLKRSLLIIRTNIDRTGAIIAGCDSDVLGYSRDTYCYMWPRDGALTAYALDMAGYHDTTRRFFNFCLDIMKTGKESVGFFLHKYNPDGSLGSSWHGWTDNGKKILPIQEDGTALVLWALWHHFDRFRDIEFAANQYENVVKRIGDFLASYTDPATGLPLPSYDLWEEKWGVHTFTASAVYAGLKAASKFGLFFGDSKRSRLYEKAAEQIRQAVDKHLYSRRHGRFLKSISSDESGALSADLTVDASTYAPFYFGLFEAGDERIINTMGAIEKILSVRSPAGGVARYEGDAYYMDKDVTGVPGNPWVICHLWLLQWRIAKAQNPEELEEALPMLEWVASRALPSGVLAEQLHPVTGKPVSVAPLTWSHSTYVSAVLQYANKLGNIRLCPVCGNPLYKHEKKAALNHIKI